MGTVDFDREFEQIVEGTVGEEADAFLDSAIRRLREMDAMRAAAGHPPVGVKELIDSFMDGPAVKSRVVTCMVAAMFRLRALEDKGYHL